MTGDDDRAKPIGDAIQLAGLLLLLTLNGSDTAAAQELWRNAIGPSWRPLLGTQYAWNDATQTFTRPSGRAVSAAQTAALRDQVETYVANELREQAHAVATGGVSIASWQRSMVDTLKSLWVVNAALAVGGWARVSQQPVLNAVTGPGPTVTTGLHYQVTRLAKFGDQLQTGERLADTVTGIERRAVLYAAASHGLFEVARRISHTGAVDADGERLFTRERNILDDAAHCDECPALTEQGWVAIGELPEPGTRECGVLCRCALEFGHD